MGSSDAMVTARMSPEKKERGNEVLDRLGTNASQVINRLYDFIIEKGALPFPAQERPREHTPEEIAAAKAWIELISVPIGGGLADLSLKEVKRLRLQDKEAKGRL